MLLIKKTRIAGPKLSGLGRKGRGAVTREAEGFSAQLPEEAFQPGMQPGWWLFQILGLFIQGEEKILGSCSSFLDLGMSRNICRHR